MIPGTQFSIEGYIAPYVKGVVEQWLLVAPFSNPAMLEMLRDRDRLPLRELVPWAGEFAGKYLTGAVEIYRLSPDPRLRTVLEVFVRQLVSLQADNGYLGPWPRDFQLRETAPNAAFNGTWDLWGHYHVMYGLLLWAQESGDEDALACARRMGDLFCDCFLDKSGGVLASCQGMNIEMNQSAVHGMALLYSATKHQPYLDLALQMVEEFAGTAPDGTRGGDYLNQALAGKEFYEMPRPRWESLHAVMGMAELLRITNDQRLRQAVEHIWWSIVKLDRHNNGGFSSGEQAQGNPYHPGAIETCCTIAWIALSVEMLRLSGSSVVADELELTTLNSVTGLHSPTGRWVTYNTPMDGVRLASAHEIVFQAREGTPELNCCSVNGARGFGKISDWAVMGRNGGLALNWYGAGSIEGTLPCGQKVVLQQETEYPRTGIIALHVEPETPQHFDLYLRIPQWSAVNKITINGIAIENVTPGEYLPISRLWSAGDVVHLEFDMSLRYWVGEKECDGKTSIYRGPLLLAYDRNLNSLDPQDLPAFDARNILEREEKSSHWLPPFLSVQLSDKEGHSISLCDFGSAGALGSPYRTWLDIHDVPKESLSVFNRTL